MAGPEGVLVKSFHCICCLCVCFIVCLSVMQQDAVESVWVCGWGEAKGWLQVVRCF